MDNGEQKTLLDTMQQTKARHAAQGEECNVLGHCEQASLEYRPQQPQCEQISNFYTVSVDNFVGISQMLMKVIDLEEQFPIAQYASRKYYSFKSNTYD
ncbi:hypothetical protein [Paucimonas lemoignei]|uniref:hypothetical protein n=1 Tax=Paucimonas lemoignei TaxID=29443 RepID=UPI001404DF9E|nr:hypothetical protein [Paucimonas lemoignei]